MIMQKIGAKMILSGNLGELNTTDTGTQIWKMMEFLQSKMNASIKILQTKFENISEIESVQFTNDDIHGKEMFFFFTIYLEVDRENKEIEDIEASTNNCIIFGSFSGADLSDGRSTRMKNKPMRLKRLLME